MGLSRVLLLRASQSAWLRDRATRYKFVRRSVSRFMPGERLDDALAAAGELQTGGAGIVLSRLGENVTSRAEAEGVAGHYLDVLDRVARIGLDAQISIKPTHLGLDLDEVFCQQNLKALVDRAEATKNFVWIDMESSGYVDRTLALYRRARNGSGRVGVCLQAYQAVVKVLHGLLSSPWSDGDVSIDRQNRSGVLHWRAWLWERARRINRRCGLPRRTCRHRRAIPSTPN